MSTGEPNNGEGENCVEVYTNDGKWNDINCNSELAVACKRISFFAPALPDEGRTFYIFFT